MIDTGHGIVEAHELSDELLRGMFAKRAHRIEDLRSAAEYFREQADKIDRNREQLEAELAELKDEIDKRGIW